MNPILLEIDADGVAVLHMRDVAGRNAFSRPFVEALVEGLGGLADERVKVAVLRGLDDVFCAGADRELLLELAEGRLSPYDLLLTRTLLEVPVPTIAAMAGHAVGGGLVLGLACDMVVLARESRYGCNFMDLGFTPGMGATGLLQAAVGEYLAAEMLYSARYVRGSELEGRSGVNAVLPKAQVLERALSLAARIAGMERYALRMLKEALVTPRRRAFEEARAVETRMHETCFARPEVRQRIRENYPDLERN